MNGTPEKKMSEDVQIASLITGIERKGIKIKCRVCGEEFSVKPYREKTAKWCSYKCSGKAKEKLYLGDNNPKWRNGRIKRSDGRICVYAPDHPYANLYGGTHILEYRILAEKKIGRYLTKDEIVHHVNGDTSDNRPENLQIMTQSQHAKMEEKRRDKKTGRYK